MNVMTATVTSKFDLSNIRWNKPAIIAGALSLLVALRLYHTRRNLNRTPKLLGPPRSSFIFGVTHEVYRADEPGIVYGVWEKKYGAVYEIPSSLGSKMLVLGDPKGIAQLFAKDTFAYHRMELAKRGGRRLFGANILSFEGEDHRRHRRAISSAFSNSAIRDLTPVFLGSANKLVTAWNESLQTHAQTSPKSVIIEVQKWMNCISLDSVGIGGFGHDFASLQGKHSSVMDAFDSFETLKPSFLDMLASLLGPLFPSFTLMAPNKRNSLFKDLAKNVKQIAGQLLSRAVQEKATEREVDNSILGVLVRSETASSNVQMSTTEIEAQNLLLFAGYETTATVLTWSLIELARNPDIQEKLRAELRERIREEEDATYDQLTNGLPYLDAFTCEILRLHPAVHEIFRTAAEDVTIPLSRPIMVASGEVIDNLPVSKGTLIRIPISGVNRSETFWGSDSDMFNPDRWLEDENGVSEAKIPGSDRKRNQEIQGYRHLMTFAFGPRMCIGRNFAVTELKAVLSVLVRKFSLELPDGPSTKVGSFRSVSVRPRIEGQTGPKVPLIVKAVKAM